MLKELDLFKDYRPWEDISSIFTDRARGILAGGATGDALGWITAEKPHIPLKRKCGLTRLKDYASWEPLMGNKYYPYIEKIRTGEYSDDTQLTLCTARSITSAGEFEPLYFSKYEFPLFLEYARGAGGSTKSAADNLKKKKINWYNNFFTRKSGNYMVIYRDGGANGAAMRIAPISIVCFNDREKLIRNIWKNTIISHGHPRALFGALLHGFALSYLLKSVYFNRTIFVDYLMKEINNLEPDFTNERELFLWEEEWNKGRGQRPLYRLLFNETKREVLDKLSMFENYFDMEDHCVYQDLGCYSSMTKRAGTGTVLAGLYMFCRYYNNIEDVIEKSVNMINTDSDTIGSFAGQLCGAFYGYRALPDRWKKGLQDEPYIIKLADRLGRISLGDLTVDDYIAMLTQGINGDFSSVRKGDVKVGDEVTHEILGRGIVEEVDIQPLPVKNRKIIFIRIRFFCGQSCKFRIIKD
ncbi:MAG: ADP-ribosylglycohydrolase family protein [Candidatus Eremiobacterota bacterium]